MLQLYLSQIVQVSANIEEKKKLFKGKPCFGTQDSRGRALSFIANHVQAQTLFLKLYNIICFRMENLTWFEMEEIKGPNGTVCYGDLLFPATALFLGRRARDIGQGVIKNRWKWTLVTRVNTSQFCCDISFAFLPPSPACAPFSLR